MDILFDLAEFEDISVLDAMTRCEHGLDNAVAESRELGDQFYVDSQQLIYDLVVFNSHQWYLPRRVSALAAMAEAHFLDFGCGIGTAAFHLASEGKEVWAYDINKRCMEFARFRNKRLGYPNVHFIDSLDDADFTETEIVYALDVFEHIADPYPILEDLYRRMKAGTKLAQASPWNDLQPLHIGSPEVYAWALKKAGFAPLDEHWAIKDG